MLRRASRQVRFRQSSGASAYRHIAVAWVQFTVLGCRSTEHLHVARPDEGGAPCCRTARRADGVVVHSAASTPPASRCHFARKGLSVIRLLQRIWSAIEEPLHFLKPLRMVAIPMALLFWGLLWSDQGQDAVRTLIEVDERLINWHANVIFCAMVTLAALQVWYWSRQLLRYDFPQYPPRVAGAGGKRDGATSHDLAMRHPRLDRWTPRILGISIYLVAAGAIGLAARDANRTAGDHTSVMALTTSVALLILAIGFGFFVVVRHRWVAEAHERVAPDETFGRVTRRILLSTVVAELLFLIWTAVTPLTAGLVFPAPSLLMISAALWVGLGSFVVYWSDRFRLPFTTAALLLAVVMSGFNDNHEVRTLTVAK